MGNICRKGEPFDPGSVLDKVIASKTASEECLIYKLANYKKGGELVDCFNKGGSKEARDALENNARMCSKYLPFLLQFLLFIFLNFEDSVIHFNQQM